MFMRLYTCAVSLTVRQLESMPAPTVMDTALVRLPLWLYNQSLGRLINKSAPETTLVEELGVDDLTKEGEEIVKEAEAANPNAESRRRKPKVRARA